MTEWTPWERVGGWDDPEVIYEKRYRRHGGGVARIMINRPHALNAVTNVHMAQQTAAIREANLDPNIGVIVLSSVGPHFGVGGDVRWEEAGGIRPEAPRGGLNPAIRHSLKPVIAAVKGYCIGASHHFAYHCDLTIAADTTIFGQNGPRVGSPIHGEVVSSLVHVIGMKRAKEVWMLCRQYTAQEALEMGLCNTVVPLNRLEDEVASWCDELLNIMPECLALLKQSFESVASNLISDDDRLQALIAPDVHDRPGVKEAQQAFFERRTPNFWAGKLPTHLQA